jgi:hypothetical protein
VIEDAIQVSRRVRFLQRSRQMNLGVQPKRVACQTGKVAAFESRFRNRKAKSVTATQLAQRLDRYEEEDFSVEEQDHK